MFRLIKMGPARPNKTWEGLFGLHVRVWAIGIALMHLIFDIISLLCIVMILQSSERYNDSTKMSGIKEYDYEDPPALPTPLSKVDPVNQRDQYMHVLSGDLMGRVCYILVTLYMLHGAVKGKPKNLLPFLVFQISDFFFTVLEAVSYLYLVKSPFHHSNYHNDDVPFRLEINQIPTQRAYVIIALIVTAVLLWKMYAIRVVWRCYKYLTIQRQIRTDLPFIITDVSQAHMGRAQGNLLPDYNEAIAESLKQAPPSYQAAMAAAEAASGKNPVATSLVLPANSSVYVSEDAAKFLEPAPVYQPADNAAGQQEVVIDTNRTPKPNEN